ncbi:hypothetical protein [Microvirga lotononidis]|uniref:Uncharacterized protein n=1 Tax=Microvirga lotononidis TaxID=864069 RepID=I4YKE9_9HYPH|nr:hypothetical protein [Microvirga lotononidis]EIM24441.1 hypothetical protein MicloDRAFT_00069600 [Microvirga lotononidis]WQO30881.1 hypothetical protein U0023_26085 [Microvirga lotononidis]
MTSYKAALVLAGLIGSFGAVIHGMLTQSHLVVPVRELSATRIRVPIQRLVMILLQFSTFNWFVGGLALIAAVCLSGQEARLAAGLLVGSSYLFAALGNLWATRGRHPGWIVYGAALGLILYGLTEPGA